MPEPTSSSIRTTLRRVGAVSLLIPLLLSPAAGAGSGQATFIYWTQGEAAGGLFRVTSTGEMMETLALRSPTIASVALDTTNDRLIYGLQRIPVNSRGPAAASDRGISGPDLMSADLDGTNRAVLVANAGEVLDIEIDSAGGKVYWASDLGVSRADLDGSNEQQLTGDAATSIALDLDGARVYWSDGDGIVRANLDGTAQQSFTTLNDAVRDLEVLAAAGKDPAQLYYSTETGSQGLQRCDLDVAGCSTIATAASLGVEIAQGQVYRYDTTLGRIVELDLDGANPTTLDLGITPGNRFDIDTTNLDFYMAEKSLYQVEITGVRGANPPQPLISAADQPHGVVIDPELGILVTDNASSALHARPLFQDELRPLSAGPDGLEPLGPRAVVRTSLGLTIWANKSDGLWVLEPGSTVAEHRIVVTGPHDLAVDEINGKVYWTNQTFGEIWRAELDLSSPTMLLSGLGGGVRGIAVDPQPEPALGKIYWIDRSNNQLRWANTDGTGVEDLLASNKPHDIAIDPLGSRIYWTENALGQDQSIGKIRSANLDGSTPLDVLTGLSTRLRDLTVATHVSPPIFSDGFETGDTSAWSCVEPSSCR